MANENQQQHKPFVLGYASVGLPRLARSIPRLMLLLGIGLTGLLILYSWPGDVYISSRGLCVPNEKFNVAQIISGQTAGWTAAELKEFGSFSHARIGPLHVVRYSAWYAGGVYWVMPLWIMVVFFVVLLGVDAGFFRKPLNRR